jgi:NitT/TauT family transport system substrate-binding protein
MSSPSRSPGRTKAALVALTFGILLATAAGCGSNADDEPSTDELTTIRIGVGSPQVEHALPAVAQELGIFEKHGIKANVELVTAGGPTVTAGLVGGSLDFGVYSGPSVEQAVVQGADLKYVGVWMHQVTASVVGAPGIDSIEDLKGQPVAVSAAGALSDMFTTIALRDAGLDPNKDIVRQNVQGQAGALSAFASGQVKGALLGGPQTITVLDQLKGSKVIAEFEDYPWSGVGVVTSGSYIDEDTETIQNVIAALQEAAAAYQDPEQASRIQEIVSDFTKVEDPAVITQTFDVVSRLIDPTLVPRPADHENVLDQIAVTEPAAKKAAASDIFDPSFTENDE